MKHPRPRSKRKGPRSPAANSPHNARGASAQEPQLVQIEKPIYGGAFLARVEGKAVFVPLTLPGEQASVRITDDRRSYATAEAEKILKKAPERVTPSCRHFGICGGCNYQHADYSSQLIFKQAILRETLERGGVRAPEEISVLAAADEAQSWQYRNRIRLAFDAQGNPGYRGRRSHAVTPIAECPIAAPLLVKAALSLAEITRGLSRALRISEVSLFCDAAETSLLASVFPTSGKVDGFSDFAGSFAKEIPEVKGVELVAKSDMANQGPGGSPRTIAQWGENSLVYGAAGFDYRVDHGAFFQVNRWLVDGLVERVTAGQQGGLACDLFAGVGLFARRLSSGFGRVVAVESAPAATGALEENLSGTTGSAVRASTLDFLRRPNKTGRPDLIVVDPPRTGLGEEITTLLAGLAAPSLTYVSCDPATVARDLRALIASGYIIQSLTLADLFPQTFHLETVVHLRHS